MNRYQSYKPSGVEWIGEIPEHWKKCRLKNVSKSINGYSFKSDDFDREYDIPVIRIGDVGDKIDFDNCIRVKSDFLTDKNDFIVFRNDILIGLTGGTIGKSGRYNYDTPSLLNQRVGLLRNNEDLLNGLLYHYVKSEVFIRYIYFDCYGGGQDNISMNDILKMVFPLPPLSEQHQIVQFLDEKTELIDNLISTKERKISLLKEQRTSLINEVVTKGLNSNVKMKDSGVEWIGEIPEGWIFKKLKHIFKYKKGFPFKSDDMGDEGIPIVKVTDIKNLTINKPKDYFTKEVDDRITRIKEKDIILTTVGSKMEVSNSSVGQLGLVGKEQDGFLLNQNTLCIRLKDNDNNVNFIFYLLQSNRFRGHLDIHSHGTVNQSSLNVEDILNYTLLVPHFNEQHQIVEYLDSKTKEIDDLVQLEQKKIDLLKEYRQSLISEVVTGKIKVTN